MLPPEEGDNPSEMRVDRRELALDEDVAPIWVGDAQEVEEGALGPGGHKPGAGRDKSLTRMC